MNIKNFMFEQDIFYAFDIVIWVIIKHTQDATQNKIK